MKKYLLLLSLLPVFIFFCGAFEACCGFSCALAGPDFSPGASSVSASQPEMDITFHIPFFGDKNARDYSLPTLAVILGLVDGFNPCAMWVLVYLISLIMSMNDPRKIWFLVGSFLLASGILYFLFMTAWLNAFLFIGYLRPLTILIGLFALWTGISNIRECILTGGAVACNITNSATKKKTMNRIEQLVSSPLTIASIFGIIALAFAVNSIEFLCSAGIPAIYTHVLAVSTTNAAEYYLYILLYVLFFMLDDLFIFGSAVFAVNSSLGGKYSSYCRVIGGVIMVVLGVLLAFFPEMLR